jgi:hypothetical protein
MKLYLSEFLDGVQQALSTKTAEDIFTIGNDTSIFPTIEGQTTWHFAKSPTRLHLNDGQKVHAFEIIGKASVKHDFPLKKLKDVPFHEFEEGAKTSGTAQVHKANPGLLYVTLHDGINNPTYTFKHISEDSWRAIPKVKSAEETPIEIDPDQFLAGVSKVADTPVLDSILKGIDWTARKGVNAVMAPGLDPLKAAGIGLLGGAAYDIGKRTLYNTPEENEQEGGLQRLSRYALPAATLGGLGNLTSSLFTNYYDHYPLYKK